MQVENVGDRDPALAAAEEMETIAVIVCDVIKIPLATA